MADRASTIPSQAQSWWSPALAGLLAMLALIGLQEALNAINQTFVSAPSAAAQTIVRLTPGPVINTMIESMGKNAIQLLTVSAYVGTALAGGVLGWGAGILRRRGAGWPAVAVLLAGASWLLYALVAPAQARPGGIIVALVVGAVLAAVFAGLTLLLWQGLQSAASVGDAAAPDPRRRVLLGGGLATVALLHGGGWAARATMQGQTGVPQALTPLDPAAAATPAVPTVAATTAPPPSTPAAAAATTAPVPTTAPATAPPAATPTTAAPAAPTAPPTSAPAAAPLTATAAPKPEDQEARDFAAIKGLSPEVTPIGKFYVVDEAIDDPRIDPKTWTLTIKGHVEKPVTLTFDELRALPFVDQYATLLCISYELGQDLISTAKWRGVRLSEVLRLAGVKAGATEVVLRSVDDYDESHAFERAMEPATMLAYGMNDVLLPRQHGAPLRAIVPGAYGFKHVKWITEVEVISGPPHQGYWEQAASWVQTGRLASAMARIDTVDSPPAKVGSPVTVAGVAFTSVRGISKVEVSDDGGTTWSVARLKAPLSPLTWRLWSFAWKPAKVGKAKVVVRAYEGDGTPQVATVQPSHPNGLTGYHSIDVEVVP